LGVVPAFKAGVSGGNGGRGRGLRVQLRLWRREGARAD